MFNIFKKVKNKVNTSEKDYSLSYDNLAIPEIHKKDSGSEEDDPDISSDIVPDDNTISHMSHMTAWQFQKCILERINKNNGMISLKVSSHYFLLTQELLQYS